LSSILKALKKLEQEESRDSKETPVWPDSIHTARKAIREKSHRWFFGTALVLLCSVVIAGFVYFRNNNTVPKINAEKVTIKKPQSPPKPMMKPVTVDLTRLKKTSEFYARLPNIVSKQTEPNKSEAPEVIPESRVGEVIDTDAMPLIEETIVPEMQKKEQEFIPTVLEEKDDLPEMAVDSRVKIQAIAWAQDSSRRFVVINNSIVREGGSIDDITVVTIEDNIVHFNENGKEWRQRFVLK